MRGSQAPRRGSELNQLNIIQDGSLLVRDGILLEVGATRRVENLAEARDALEISAAGRVVMPGFIDSHTHLLFPPPDAPADDLEAQLRIMRATTARQLGRRARKYLYAMACHGTTIVEVKTAYGADASAEMKILNVLAELQEEPVEVIRSLLFRPALHSSTAPEASVAVWRWMCTEFLPNLRRRKLVDFVDLAWDSSPHENVFRGYFQVAQSLALGRKLHADVPNVFPAAVTAVEHRAVSIDHLEHATASDMAMLSRSNTVTTILPCGSFYRGCPDAPARDLIDAGAPVAIATDFNPLQSPLLSMQAALAIACQRMHMQPAEAISAATINGAHALGCASRTGSLEHGKQADLLFLNVADYRELTHSLGTNLVHMVMKRGEVIYEEGRVGVRPAEDLQPSW